MPIQGVSGQIAEMVLDDVADRDPYRLQQRLSDLSAKHGLQGYPDRQPVGSFDRRTQRITVDCQPDAALVALVDHSGPHCIHITLTGMSYYITKSAARSRPPCMSSM